MVHQSNSLRRLGHSDITVSALGLGCMGMTWAYGPTDEAESLRVLRRYVELGGNFLDTSRVYGPYTNEQLLGRFLREIFRDSVVVATKFGLPRSIRPTRLVHRIAHRLMSSVRVMRAWTGSASRLSTCSISIEWTLEVLQLKKPSAQWLNWFPPVKCAHWVYPKLARKRCAEPPRCIQLPRSRASIRFGPAMPRNKRCCCYLPRTRYRFGSVQPARPRFLDRCDPKSFGS